MYPTVSPSIETINIFQTKALVPPVRASLFVWKFSLEIVTPLRMPSSSLKITLSLADFATCTHDRFHRSKRAGCFIMLAVDAPLIIVKSTHPRALSSIIRTENRPSPRRFSFFFFSRNRKSCWTARGFRVCLVCMCTCVCVWLVERFVDTRPNLFASVNTEITMVRERDADKRRRHRTCPTTLRHVPDARDRETELPHRLENVTKKEPDRVGGPLSFRC